MKCRICGKKLKYSEECSNQWVCPDWKRHDAEFEPVSELDTLNRDINYAMSPDDDIHG